MQRLIVGIFALAVALAVTAAAGAGCFATVGIEPLPSGVEAGQTWTVSVRVLQHGRTPLASATPVVLISNQATGEVREFPAAPGAPAGLYGADVVFPSAGRWDVAVEDGFPVAECVQVHTFGAYSIGAPSPPSSPGSGPSEVEAAAPSEVEAAGSSFPVWQLGLGFGLALVCLAAAGAGLRARRRRPSLAG